MILKNKIVYNNMFKKIIMMILIKKRIYFDDKEL